MKLESEFTEKLIFKGLLADAHYNALVCSAISNEYFENENSSILFETLKEYFQKYKQIPEMDIILNIIPEKNKESVSEYINEVKAIDIDVSKNYNFIVEETEKWLKASALKSAILDSADILNSGNVERYGNINSLVKEALTKSLNFDIGTNYFEDMGKRLQRMFDSTTVRINSGYHSLDELTSGGFPKKSLTLFFGRTHGNKSSLMINLAARQVLAGKTIVIFTLEMSEDMVSQRLDSIFSGYDINRIYVDRKKELINELSKLKDKEKGSLIIKEFPTGVASTNHFRSHLYELAMRNIKPDILYCDYLGLMRPEIYKSKDGLYEAGKQISVELRGLSFEFDIPIVSASQINRSGSTISLEEVDFVHVAESYGISATADFISILGIDTDLLTYTNELHYKIVKNRFGGRIGTIGKFYIDPFTLKIYDETEMDDWFEDAKRNSEEPREVYSK